MRSGRRSSKGPAGRGRRHRDSDTGKGKEDKDKDYLEKTLKKMRRGEEESEEVVEALLVGADKDKTKKEVVEVLLVGARAGGALSPSLSCKCIFWYCIPAS